ncbi:MAG: 1-deoxy-D-xylulose-5-phosphate synthase [Deltaproteobacteria bacterium]|nr:1-deoxy-D-xylulose-5-phosphate synthase [Deltaproteobacteria bacterium]
MEQGHTNNEAKGRFIDRINNPADLKKLDIADLEPLAAEIRDLIIETVARNGGHLAPSLGVVELTIALHYVFNSPQDKIIWDVGHQAYAHKIITGRRCRFHTLRKDKGISGFPKREESPCDPFNTGHSGTSISAGLGIATARSVKEDKDKVIAVIGDGAMTAGMAFEALNQAGHTERDLLVVLNDNEMSIAKNVGALSSYFSRKISEPRFVNLKKSLEAFFRSIPSIGDNIFAILKRSEDSLIGLLTPGMLFEALKFRYIGPINGHNINLLIRTFTDVSKLEGPVLVHVLTSKGKGYQPAEENPTLYHGIGAFDVATGLTPKGSDQDPPSFTEVFGKTMVELGAQDKRLFAITAAMREGTGLSEYAKTYPDRFIDVGIAEQHAVTFAAGLATEGLKPVVAIYSTFLQRSFDQIIHDVCLPNLPVIFCLDRGGIVGEDGPTHHGTFDLSYLRIIPNMSIMAPKDEDELRHMLFTALDFQGPVAIRYPRGKGVGVPMNGELVKIPIGKAEVLTKGKDLLILAIGSRVYPCLEAAKELNKKGYSASVVNCRFVKPLEPRLSKMASNTGKVLIVEENTLQGGFGSAVLESFADRGVHNVTVKRLGIPDMFIEHGSQDILRERCKIDTKRILLVAKKLCSHDGPPKKTA